MNAFIDALESRTLMSSTPAASVAALPLSPSADHRRAAKPATLLGIFRGKFQQDNHPIRGTRWIVKHFDASTGEFSGAVRMATRAKGKPLHFKLSGVYNHRLQTLQATMTTHTTGGPITTHVTADVKFGFVAITGQFTSAAPHSGFAGLISLERGHRRPSI